MSNYPVSGFRAGSSGPTWTHDSRGVADRLRSIARRISAFFARDQVRPLNGSQPVPQNGASSSLGAVSVSTASGSTNVLSSTSPWSSPVAQTILNTSPPVTHPSPFEIYDFPDPVDEGEPAYDDVDGEPPGEPVYVDVLPDHGDELEFVDRSIQ